MRPRHVGRWQASRLAQLDVARVQDAGALVLEQQLRRAEHVSRRVQRHGRRAAPHRFVVAEHPPAAWTPRLGDERKCLRREQRLLVAAGVVRVRVRDEGERSDHQGIEPHAMAGDRNPSVPDDLGTHVNRTVSSSAKRS
jgi:hypothetical protein